MEYSLGDLDTGDLRDMLDGLKADLKLLELSAGALPQPLIPAYREAILDIEQELKGRHEPGPSSNIIDRSDTYPSWDTICDAAKKRKEPKIALIDYTLRIK